MNSLTTDSFTIELVSNAWGDLLLDNTMSSFLNFLPEQVVLQGQSEVAISEISYPSIYPNITEGKFKFFDEKPSKSTLTYNLEPGLFTSITYIVGAMYTLIQERNNHNETCITVRVSRRTQKTVIVLANHTSDLAFCSTDLGHIFGNNVQNELGLLVIGESPYEHEFAYNIVRIHSLMIYSNLVEYNIVGDTKARLLRCFPFISKLKGGDIITTGQYMNYQTFSNLQFRPLLKKSFHSIHIDLRDTLAKKLPLVSVGITRLVLRFRKVSSIHLYHIRFYKMVVPRQVEVPYYRAVRRQKGTGFGALAQVIGRSAELQFLFWVNMSSQRQNE